MKPIGNRALFFDLSLDLHCIASPEAKFLHINERWEKVLGFTEEELKAGTFLDLVHPEDIEKTLAAMDQLNQGLEVAKFSNRYRTKDAAYRVFDWNALYDPDHQLYYATARDVTEERVAAERSEATNRMLSAINHARDLYLSQGMNAGWWDQMLGDVLELTGSEYGFIGAIEEDEEGRYLRTFAVSYTHLTLPTNREV